MVYRSPKTPEALACTRCGSTRIIPDVPLIDRYGKEGLRSAPLDVQVEGDPEAWVFRDSASGHLLARICGDCGYTELRTENHAELYDKYLASLEREEGAEPGDEAGEEVPAEDRPPRRPRPPGRAEGTECLSCGEPIPEGADRCSACGWSWEDEPEEP